MHGIVLDDIFKNWKTSVSGVAISASVFASSYHAGMSWKQWGIAGAIALLGFWAKDPK